MPSPRFKLVVAIMAMATLGVYLVEPYLGLRPYEQYRPAAPIALSTIDGSTFNLSAHKGRVVVVDFMATWCPPCRDETGELRKVRDAFAPEALTILTIDIEYSETTDQLGQFRAAYAGYNGSSEAGGWYFARDTVGEYAGPRYGAAALPTLVLVDPSGLIRQSWVGAVTSITLMGAIGPLVQAPGA